MNAAPDSKTAQILAELASAKRKLKKREDPASERWLISYADMMTLLFGFFVLLYSPQSRFEEMSSAASQQFGAPESTATRKLDDHTITTRDINQAKSLLGEACRVCVQTQVINDPILAQKLEAVPGHFVLGGVTPGGPGDRAGLEAGDTLLSIDGEDISGALAMNEAISAIPPGGKATFKVSRHGQPLSFVVELDALLPEINDFIRRDKELHPADSLGSGISVADLTLARKIKYYIPEYVQGTIVASSPCKGASNCSFPSEGSVILQVGETKTPTAALLAGAIQHGSRQPALVWQSHATGATWTMISVP
jgi:membrane-associated protease RseP (regulator of RpoE activity)